MRYSKKQLNAARYLAEKNGNTSLATAINLNPSPEIETLLPGADAIEKQKALAIATSYGNSDVITLLLKYGVDVNSFNPEGFHAHTLPIHQAIVSGSLESVKLLVEAGSNLRTRDKIYFGPPLGWVYTAGILQKQRSRKKNTPSLQIISVNA